MKYKTYSTYSELKQDVIKAVYSEAFNTNNIIHISMSMYNHLNEREIVLALAILRERQPIIGYKLYNAAKSLELNWKVSKRNILKALSVYSWGNGNQITIDGDPIGDEKDIYLFLSEDRLKHVNKTNESINLI